MCESERERERFILKMCVCVHRNVHLGEGGVFVTFVLTSVSMSVCESVCVWGGCVYMHVCV